MMWLTGRPVPDHKTIADFRKDSGCAIRKVCARFIALCRAMAQSKRPNGDHSGFAPLKAHQNGGPSRLAVIIRRALLCALLPNRFYTTKTQVGRSANRVQTAEPGRERTVCFGRLQR